jgi:hypothetical protein
MAVFGVTEFLFLWKFQQLFHAFSIQTLAKVLSSVFLQWDGISNLLFLFAGDPLTPSRSWYKSGSSS